MLQYVKRFLPTPLKSCGIAGGLALLMAGAQCGFGFALLGPFNEPYMAPVISLNLGGDIGGPKNLGEEYRRNTPIQFYAFDNNFLDYFGSNGVVAVEQAIAIMNGLSNFTAYSSDLSEVPLEATGYNFRAQALHLLDLKTSTLSLLTEEYGLAEPDRYTWLLRDRRTQPGLSCPFMIYNVIKRNFDPVTFEPSSYVNGTLYTYIIFEVCTGPIQADAVEFPVDPLANEFSAVASFGAAFNYGAFWTGFTRDDVGGFRYLYRTNNMNVEIVSDDSLEIFTNLSPNAITTIVTSNLTLLAEQSLTNDAATLRGLYPNLIISSTSNFFVNVRTTNVFAFFTNEPFAPAGNAVLKIVTNYTTNVQARFSHSFANVVTNTFSTNGFVTVLDENVVPEPFAPIGTVQTNTTIRTVFVPGLVTGDFYIIPTNLCGLSIIATQLTTVLATTNVIVVATNAAGVTNVNNQGFNRSVVFYFTNRTFVVNPVVCLTNTVALRQGMDTFKFVRVNFDSLLGRFFQPITNHYTLRAVTNSQVIVQTFQRIVTAPDVLFTAEERQAPDLAWLGVGFRTVPNYDTNGISPPPSGTIYGPGTMQSPIIIEFNKVGPLLINVYNPFFVFSGLSESTGTTNFIWGSYDASTNAPIIYPQGTSITDLENQVLFGVSTFILPGGTVGVSYNSAQLQTFGGTPPIMWSLAPASPGLPPGLTLSPGGVISGTPTQSGTFDFTVRAAESGGRTADRAQEITIN